jgi:hypothetical protein
MDAMLKDLQHVRHFFTQSERLICLTYILGLTGFAGLVIDYLLWKTT